MQPNWWKLMLAFWCFGFGWCRYFVVWYHHGTVIHNDPISYIFSPIWCSTYAEVYPALKDLVMILRVSSQYIGSCLRPMMKDTESDIDIRVRYVKRLVALQSLEAIDAEEEQWEARCIDTNAWNSWIFYSPTGVGKNHRKVAVRSVCRMLMKSTWSCLHLDEQTQSGQMLQHSTGTSRALRCWHRKVHSKFFWPQELAWILLQKGPTRSPVFVEFTECPLESRFIEGFWPCWSVRAFPHQGLFSIHTVLMQCLVCKGGIRKRHRTVRFEERWSRCIGRRSLSKTNMLMLQFMDQENKKARQALDESLFLFEIAESSWVSFFSVKGMNGMLCWKEEKKKFNAEVRQLVKSSPYLQMGNSNKSVSFRVRVPNCCPRCRSVEAAYMRRFVQKRDPRVLAHQKQQMKAFFALHFLPSREDNFLRFAMLNPKDLLFLIFFRLHCCLRRLQTGEHWKESKRSSAERQAESWSGKSQVQNSKA